MQLIFSHVQNDVGATRCLRPVMIELGTTGNPTADSCRVYNYYVGAANVSACSSSAAELPSNWPSGNNNNGNVAGYYYNDNVNTGLRHSATYHYDPVNRLSSAAATGNSTYSQTISYDQYGNMGCAANPAETKCIGLTYGPTTNRITTSGYGYDLAGNLTGDGTYTYQWDGEERLSKVINGLSVAISTNTYNALGQRVRDVTQTATTDEAYGAGGALLWRYTGNSSDPNQRAFVPFGERILAEYYSGGTIFDHPDEIGSATTSSDYTGNTFNEKLFYPFGELWTGAAIPNFNMHQTFAQLPDYDSETDQYNTLNRHYNPSGRWLSPDPGGLKVVRLDDPQTWNMYVYARNNPTTVTDPSGLAPEPNGDRWSANKLYEGCTDFGWCGDEGPLIESPEVLNETDTKTQALENQAQNQYDPKKTGPEDPANPGKPLYQNSVVQKASDQAFMTTTNGQARSGLAEAGFSIEYKDGKISIANKVDSVHSDKPANELNITTDANTIAILHTHGNSALATPSLPSKDRPGDVNSRFPNFVRSQSALYVTVPGTGRYIQLVPAPSD